MPLREDEAFVLRAHPLGESDKLVCFLTRSAGKVRGVAKGARRSRRRFGSSLELLSRVRLTYFERERVDLARIDGADLLESFYQLQEDPERGAVLASFAEITDAFAREQQEDALFFRLLHAVLRAVREGLDLGWAARYFEIWTLKLHGSLPPLGACVSCGATLGGSSARYRRRESGLLCGACLGASQAGDLALPRASLEAMGEILKSPPSALVGRPGAPVALGPLAAMTEALFLDLTDRRFKSYSVLSQLSDRG